MYHVYHPEGGRIAVLSDRKGAIDYANTCVDEERTSIGRDDLTWPEYMLGIGVYEAPADMSMDDVLEQGKLIARAYEVDVVHRPIDLEDGYYDPIKGESWPPSIDYRCDYKVQEIR